MKCSSCNMQYKKKHDDFAEKCCQVSELAGYSVEGLRLSTNLRSERHRGRVRGWLPFFTDQAKHIQSLQALTLQQHYPVNTHPNAHKHEIYTPLKERYHFLSWSSCDVSELSKRKSEYNWSCVETCQSERWGAFHNVYQFCSSCSVLICVLQ